MLPSITHEDDHFAKYCIKIGWEKNTLKYGTKNRKGYITTPYIFLKGVS
jgi:hypothetical protein